MIKVEIKRRCEKAKRKSEDKEKPTNSSPFKRFHFSADYKLRLWILVSDTYIFTEFGRNEEWHIILQTTEDFTYQSLKESVGHPLKFNRARRKRLFV